MLCSSWVLAARALAPAVLSRRCPVQDDYAHAVLAEIDDLLEKFSYLDERRMAQASETETRALAAEFVTGAVAAARRATGDRSQYVRQMEDLIDEVGWFGTSVASTIFAGMLRALRGAVASGHLVTVGELVRAEVFSDFLDMAEYLLHEGYKDAAAVLLRGVLEAHLRELCARNNIDRTYTNLRGKTVPKPVGTMNAELKKAGVYLPTDEKGVTSWYGLGTEAAHGNYTNYTPEQVKLTLQCVRDFLARHPA
jgi:hypothetical protein